MLTSSLVLLLVAPTLLQTQRTDYAWFDSLGKTNALKLPMVEVRQHFESPIPDWVTAGFLVRGTGKDFAVLQPDLFGYTSPDEDGRSSMFKTIDFETFAKKALAVAKAPPPDDFYEERETGAPYHFVDALSLFVISRACELRGLHDLSQALYQQAAKAPHYSYHQLSGLEAFKDDVAASLYGQINADIGDLRVPRKNLLEQYQFIVTHFPGTEYAKSAKKMAEELEPMVVEEASHSPQSYQAIQKLPMQERIDELVFQLRDQNGRQWMEPGYCDVFADPRNEKSPADQLVKIGVPAVPALIKTFEDMRPTRSIGSGMRSAATEEPLTIEDVSLAVLGEIAQRRFADGVPSNLGEKKRILQWWAAVQAVGEETYLVRAVSAGGMESSRQARKLVELYPDSAFNAIRDGIANPKDPSERSYLIDVLSTLRNPSVIAIGREQMLHGKDIPSRLAGARIVVKQDSGQAASEMAKVWMSTHSDGQDELIRFLTSTPEPVAARALLSGIRRRNIDDRIDIVEQFIGGLPTLSGTPRTQNEYRRSVEDLLASELTDDEIRDGSSMSVGDRSFEDPRVADVATCALADCFPKKYFYKEVGSPREQLRIRLVALNTWRRQRGLKSVALPRKPIVGRLDPLRAKTTTSAKVIGRHPSSTVARELRTMVGKKISGRAVIHLANEIVKNWPQGTRTVILLAVREDDNAGFSITTQLLGPREARESQNDMDLSVNVRAGTKTIGSISGGGNPDETDRDFTGPIDKALTYPPLTSVVIRITLSKRDNSLRKHSQSAKVISNNNSR